MKIKEERTGWKTGGWRHPIFASRNGPKICGTVPRRYPGLSATLPALQAATRLVSSQPHSMGRI